MSVHPRHVMAKAARHLIPFLILCDLLSYLDRVNIGFAALTMNKDLGLSANAFGFGASIFFLGYFLFEVPSNLLLEKFGARIWAVISLGQDLLLEHIPRNVKPAPAP
jgi:MFS transporter, ACS family, tartrate transporter